MDFTLRKVLKDNAKTFMQVGAKMQKTMARPEAQEFAEEIAVLAKNLQKAQEIVTKMGGLAKDNKFDSVLFNSVGFLSFSANLVASWRLLEGAIAAKIEMPNAKTQEDKDYYQSKMVDFRFFVQQQLVKNAGIAQSILNFKEDLSVMDI